jgi:glycosyltransferase involved in cell wall biosynthesis
MRVLLVNDYREMGGCERVMQRTEAGLRARGHVVSEFTGADAGGVRTPASYIDNRRARRALRRRLDAFTPDVVHFFNVYHVLSPAVLAEAHAWRGGRDTRLVMTCPDANLVCPNAALQRFAGRAPAPVDADEPLRTGLWRTRWDHRSRAHSLLKSARHAWNYEIRKRWRCLDAVACASAFLEGALSAAGLPCVLLPDPLPESLPPPRPRDEGGPLRLLFCGRVEPEKGLAEFVTAAAGVPGWTLVVVGDGAELGRVKGLVARLGIGGRVAFHGRLAAAEAVERIAGAHVLVQPSRCSENAPAAMFEALACGTGLLASDLGGTREIITRSGVGRLFDPFDPGDIQRALLKTVRRHEEDGLAPVDASAFLAGRGVEKYLDRIESLYDGGGGMRCAC